MTTPPAIRPPGLPFGPVTYFPADNTPKLIDSQNHSGAPFGAGDIHFQLDASGAITYNGGPGLVYEPLLPGVVLSQVVQLGADNQSGDSAIRKPNFDRSIVFGFGSAFVGTTDIVKVSTTGMALTGALTVAGAGGVVGKIDTAGTCYASQGNFGAGALGTGTEVVLTSFGGGSTLIEAVGNPTDISMAIFVKGAGVWSVGLPTTNWLQADNSADGTSPGGETSIVVKHAGTSKRATVGAADSGGAGFRLLRVAN